MLKIENVSLDVKPYPSDVVALCKNSKNGMTRLMGARNSEESPLLESMVNTEEASINNAEKLTLFEHPSPVTGKLYDAFEIRNFDMPPNNNMGVLNAYVSLLNTSSNITLSADIIHTSDQRILGVIDPVKAVDANYLELNHQFTIDPSINHSEVAALVYANWIDNGNEVQLSMLYELYMGDERLTYEHHRPSTTDRGVIIGNPLNLNYDKKSAADFEQSHIVVSLYRMPDDMSDVNYVCGFGMGQTGPYLGIPARGIFTMPSNYIACQSGPNAPVAQCVLGPRQGGGKMISQIIPEYTTDCAGMTFTANGNQLIYDMAWNWGICYREPAGFYKSEFDYELRLKITFQNIQTKAFKSYYPRITSVENDISAFETIKPLYIMYGCLEGNTMIKMSDGDLKPISKIVINDVVLNSNGQACRVKNVWRGTEDDLYEIRVEDKRIKMSSDHPIALEKGIARAKSVQAGMRALMADGQYKEISEVNFISHKDAVYNLDLESVEGRLELNEHLIIANDFVVGDNILQNQGDFSSQLEA